MSESHLQSKEPFSAKSRVLRKDPGDGLVTKVHSPYNLDGLESISRPHVEKKKKTNRAVVVHF